MIAWPVAELLPHAADMILIDQVLAFDDDSIQTRVTVRPDGLFNTAEGHLPAWVGIELMAQSVAAFAGCQARQRGEAVQLGFLLGTRKYECTVDHFPVGSELTLNALRTLQDDNGMGVFECRLSGPDLEAFARLSVYCPPNAADYLNEDAAHD
ncbi:hotdog family protein [Pseudomonas syringae]|nr:hotdog family protein [Pseudomonas syringae]MBD8575678.1 hotdog family protein [Pseudomonas syringae]MBD8788543.1 hotdog family protein [Pseudomonas syringae]MBD8801601.1 hotdog family protein [Pseudomonas syringae]MBD8811454.1 hotdog family protein [Pseudomonas syringae]